MKASGVTNTILQDLGAAIVSKKFGETSPKVIEADLCETYGASRSVMREAIKMLVSKGLISSKPKQGTRICPPSEWNLLDPDVLRWMLEGDFSIDLLREFTEIRMGIERQSVLLASRNATPEDHQMMMACVEGMEAAEAGENDPLQSDIDLHLAILKASHNRFLNAHAPLVDTALRFSIQLSNKYKRVRIANVSDHRNMVEAIIARDGYRAMQMIEMMMNEVMSFIATAQKDIDSKGAA
ncbi:FadR/GntR family transcriptional regulator [Hirschia litorea]|uniref:FadR/GntR family transcriptional regulator n=1 Tax=Hirschia litorea TaxID=1199156 RepID=A0ABW2IQ73_9PROT